MATIVDALLVTLGVDSSGVDKGMAEAQERINSGVKNIVSALTAPLMAAFAGLSAGAAGNSTTTTNINGPITIATQATDAKGIAADFSRDLREEMDMTFAVDTGVRQ